MSQGGRRGDGPLRVLFGILEEGETEGIIGALRGRKGAAAP